MAVLAELHALIIERRCCVRYLHNDVVTHCPRKFGIDRAGLSAKSQEVRHSTRLHG